MVHVSFFGKGRSLNWTATRQAVRKGRFVREVTPSRSRKAFVSDEKEFQNMWAVVTGGSRGIGHAIALHFAEKGANVAIIYLEHHVAANETLQAIRARNVEAEKYQVDVSQHTAIQEAFAKMIAAHGQIDVLINCAGINRDKTMSNLPFEAWQEVLNTNLNGAFNCTKAVWDHMKSRRYGRIVSISSIVGQTGNLGQANYSASKAGLLGFTKSLALEGARYGITANAICPGFIDTDMVRAMPPEALEKVVARVPVQRLGQPEEIARTVAFLAAPEAGYITGQIIAVNGGLYM